MTKTNKEWESMMAHNSSFYGRAWDICNLLNIQMKDFKQYWLKSEFGLIYILKYAIENKRLP